MNKILIGCHAVVLVVLVITNCLLTAVLINSIDRAESAHDELLVVTGQLVATREAYSKLLERVGGADPFPTPPKRPNGKLGDKS